MGVLHLVPVPIAAVPAPARQVVDQGAGTAGVDGAAGTAGVAGTAGAAGTAAAAAAGAMPPELPGSATTVLPPATLSIARSATYFLVENARSARAFLKAAGHPQPIASLRIVEIGHAPRAQDIDGWLAPLQTGADDGVLLSEAGCPGIADPGASIVARAHALGIRVVPWVGPSSIVLALMASGMNGQQFSFLGYLPQAQDALRERLLALQRDAQRGVTQVFIETPYRNARLLEAIVRTCDARLRLCTATALTGPDEQIEVHDVAHWRTLLASGGGPDLDRRPTVFLLLG